MIDWLIEAWCKVRYGHDWDWGCSGIAICNNCGKVEFRAPNWKRWQEEILERVNVKK